MQFVCKRVTVMYIPSNYLHLHVHNMYIGKETELRGPHTLSEETDLRGAPYSKQRN